MKRRMLLLLTTLAAMLGAFYAYWIVAGPDAPLGGQRAMRAPPRPPATAISGRPGAIDNVDELCIVARDAEGRLEAVYLARKLNRRPDGSYHLVDPRVELYHRNGQQTVLRANEAEVYGEQLDRGASVRRAVLHGDVRIYFDPNTRADRTPVEQRIDEAVRVHVENVEFDSEHLTIRTDGRVTVFSPEADIYGTGLTISWNESPRELRLLRIERGQYMAVYDVPEELDVIAVPGGTGEALPEAGGAAASREPPAGGALPGAGPAATSSAPATAPGAPPAQNQYLAEFHENVKVVHRNRSLSWARQLTLKFDWDPSWRQGPKGYLGSSRRRAAGGAGASQAAAPAATQAADGRLAQATMPAGPAPPEPMEVFWTGPLILRPVGHTATPSRQRYEVAAEGDRLVLTDPRATALCREFLFRYPEQAGHLRTADGHRVRLLLAEGADVACEQIRFEPAIGRAYLDGAGYMSRRFDKGLSQDEALALIDTERAVTAPQAQRITWTGGAELAFAPEKVQRGDGRIEMRQVPRRADFHRGVELLQSGDANGDLVRCDDLAVHMARGTRSDAYPREAVATGNVSARQEGSDIRADRITVRFREGAARAAATAPAGPAADYAGAVEPTFVLAEGTVRLADRRDPNDDPLQASADRMESDLIARTAVLSGQPADIQRGPNRMTGKVIRLDQAEGSAAVDGAGKLHFLTGKDINGNRLSQPRPVEVVWSEAMNFRGEKRTAAFRGDVTLDSGMDHVSCQSMQLLFADPPPEAGPPVEAPSQPAAGADADAAADARTRSDRFRNVGVGMERYSRRRISMILAEKDVTLRSRRENDANQIVRRIQLMSDKLIYDAEAARMTTLGRGTFVAEDYLPPERRSEPAAAGITPAVDHPSQTAFEWGRSMQFSQKERLVVLDGQAKMVHRSGDQVVLTERLNVPRDLWGSLPQGRKTVLVCDNMMAQFAEPNEPATTRPARDPLEKGPDLGRLELFRAVKDVNLKDGPRQVLAQRLIYNRTNDVAVVWGFPEGQAPANATILYEDPATGRSQSWSSPKIVWYQENNRIITEDVTGSGGR